MAPLTSFMSICARTYIMYISSYLVQLTSPKHEHALDCILQCIHTICCSPQYLLPTVIAVLLLEVQFVDLPYSL